MTDSAETGLTLPSSVVDALQFPVAVVDEGGRFAETNAAWEAFVADADTLPLETAPGEPFIESLLAADDERVVSLAQRVESMLTDGTDFDEYTYQGDDGATERIRLATVSEGEDHYLFVSHVEERSEGVAAELDLKERAMDEAPVGITISDPSLPDNPVIYANHAFEHITGYPVEAVIGRNCRFLQGEGTSEETRAAIREAVETDVPITIEIRNYRRDGTPFWNEVSIAPLRDDDGTVTHYVGFQRDVTDRHEAEAELERERDRLAVLNQIVRHDIRNDMAVVVGWGEHLRSAVSDEDEEALERVLNAATHTIELTKAVRDLQEILGEDDQTLDVVDLSDVLRKEIDRVRSSFDYRSEPLTITGDSELPDSIQVEATSLLSSVFGNLLDNAVFHNDEEHVEIHVAVEPREETVVVQIADNGPGIPDSQKREVFGRGERGLESAGSGLGLYLVDSLVQTYGGSVWIEDNEPKGTVFCVEVQRA